MFFCYIWLVSMFMKNQSFTIYFDEAGRWPLAGPLFIWLTCPITKLSKKELLPFCDSKQITESKREELFTYIENLKSEWKIISTPARMTAAEIDKYGMSNALHLAILRWMFQIFNELFPEAKIKNELPNPLATKIKTNLEVKADAPANGGLFANAKISADALKKLTENED